MFDYLTPPNGNPLQIIFDIKLSVSLFPIKTFRRVFIDRLALVLILQTVFEVNEG